MTSRRSALIYLTEEIYAPTSAGFCTDRFTVDSERSPVLWPLSAEDIKLVLGRQHMCPIVKKLWLAPTSPIEEGGQAVAESNLPREMQFIYRVILGQDTPL